MLNTILNLGALPGDTPEESNRKRVALALTLAISVAGLVTGTAPV